MWARSHRLIERSSLVLWISAKTYAVCSAALVEAKILFDKECGLHVAGITPIKRV